MNPSVPPVPPDSSIGTRAGWRELSEAIEQLHAAELLVGDPIATSTTAVPHLLEFWRSLAKAGVAAGIGGSNDDPDAWLAAELPGLDAGTRAALRAQRGRLEAGQPPSKRELRAQITHARALLSRLEPEIGGVPLRRRKQRIAWASVAALLLLTPIATYLALHVEIPGTGPWRAAYYPAKDFEATPVIMREASIDHDWKDTAPNEKIAPDKFSVRWDTCLHVEADGLVVFQINANDGARLLIDGEQVIDAWDRDPKTRKRGFGSAEVELSAGVHHLRVEYYESAGAAHMKLSASLDGTLPGPLDREHLSYPGDEFDEQDVCAAVR